MRANGDYRFISSDSHIYEPVDLWTARMDKKFRERAPRVDSKPEGDYYIIDGVPPVPVGIDGAILEQKLKTGTVEHGFKGNRHTDARPQASDPRLRLGDQDLDNLRAEVIYPNTWELRIYNAPDPEYAAACATTYNAWLADFCATDLERLIGVPVITCKGDIEFSVREVERCAKLGFRTVHVPVDVVERPYCMGTYYDPLWATCQDLDLVVATHIGATTAPASLTRMQAGTPVAYIASTARMMPQTLGNFIGGGILQRFPKLRVVMVECGIGWIPSVLRFMDKFWSINRKWMEPVLDERPSFYFKRQMFATFEGSKEDLSARQFLGSDRFLWGSDYPHTEGTFPRSKHDVTEDFSDLPDEDVRKITEANAARLYGI